MAMTMDQTVYKETFNGKQFRVRFYLSDWRNNYPASERRDEVYISVRALPQTAHSATAFCHGQYVYSGSDFKRAWRALEEKVGHGIPVPEELKSYQSDPLTAR